MNRVRWPCILLATLCCLLALATSASAEGAWVLWNQSTTLEGEGPWSVGLAYPSMAACVQQLDHREAAARKDGSLKTDRHASTELAIWSYSRERSSGKVSKDSVFITSRCLPDTVDPRGPKGK